ncbi:MAG: UDP-3-O-(3-hydroxymyristoyl)glucosamine N-acyltransferase [Bacteroidaceae bacterium]
MEFTAKQIAEYLNGTIEGDEQITIHTFSKIEEGVAGAIAFLANPHYVNYIYETKASIVLVNNDLKLERPVTPTLIRVNNAYESVARLLTLYEQAKSKKVGVHPLAYIAKSATVRDNCYIAPFAYIGENVTVGENTMIYSHVSIEDNAQIGNDCIVYPNVSIYHDCRIGNRVVLHAGCVIGADGFGFAPTSDGYEKIPQIGIVTIEDDVEIGANSCVDRSTMGSTYVRKGVKLDNLVQIAHNVEVGENTVMSAQVGVAGSTKIGKWCMFGGQVGINGHIVIGDKVNCGAQAGIVGAVPKGNVNIQGSPAIEYKNFARSSIIFKKLPEIYIELNAMRKEIETLKNLIK